MASKKCNMYIIGGVVLTAVLRIRIWILLTLSINSKKTLDFSCFVTLFTEFCRDIVITNLSLLRHHNYEIKTIVTS